VHYQFEAIHPFEMAMGTLGDFSLLSPLQNGTTLKSMALYECLFWIETKIITQSDV